MSSPDSNDSSIMLNNLRSKPYRVAWQPMLDEVLNNTAPPPYTLSAFIKYISQNHCHETLEFILEAKQYHESYSQSLVESAGESIETTNSAASINLSKLYQLLLTTFILPGAAREINLSFNIRDALLRHKNMSIPPLPETLDPAMKSIYKLMEDSIFLPFLTSPSTFLHKDPTLQATNKNDIRPYLSCISSDNQPTKAVQTKGPSLNPFGRTWSWPHWSR